jgi:hypothetical protein
MASLSLTPEEYARQYAEQFPASVGKPRLPKLKEDVIEQYDESAAAVRE